MDGSAVISENKYYNLCFSSLKTQFSEKLGEASLEFWNCEYQYKFFSISDMPLPIQRGDEYFVTSIALTKNESINYKLSKNLVRNYLTNALGGTQEAFHFENITELEVKILNGFNHLAHKFFLEFLNFQKGMQISEDKTYITFFVAVDNITIGKIIITLPTDILNLTPPEVEPYKYNLETFYKTPVEVSVSVGSTKVNLSDLKAINIDDIIVLDNSNLNRMKISMLGQTKEFKINPDHSLMLDLDGGDDNIMSDEITKNIWDSIQVEVGAEFDKIKMSLGELKQISEGIVVDLASIYENKIDLKVENKIIASGELVIINDKYGVRIDNVYHIDDQQSHNAGNEQNYDEIEESEPPSLPADSEVNEEDFDYSDFDVDDEDI